MKNNLFFEKLFQNPPAEYRSKPFWAWNGKLKKDILLEQINIMKEMGYGGFHIHSRIGLDTEYLGESFMDCVRSCYEHARNCGLETWLYDEDKWPSGYGAGRVTGKEEYRARYLLLSPVFRKDGFYERPMPVGTRITASGSLTLAASYAVSLRKGKLVQYRRLTDEAERTLREPGNHTDEEEALPEIYPENCSKAAGDDPLEVSQEKNSEINTSIWYVYRVIAAEQPWFNNSAYVDTLNPEAIQKFAEVSYEPYSSLFEGHFPEDVPGIFTDEPQMVRWQRLGAGEQPEEASVPFTESLRDKFLADYGCAAEDILPEVFWDWEDGRPARRRWQYFKMLTEQFDQAYGGTLGDWCERNGLLFTGHLMDEGSLSGQSRTSGDAMYCYRHYQLPGIDILADRYEYSTVKQAQSVSRQCKKAGVSCELYGVTNWDFTFGGKKRQGDWLAALGVTHRVPHLLWYSMGGEAKRDYPAPLDAHSPWYRENRLLENYFARLAAVLRRGKSIVRIALLHPVESQWMLSGPVGQDSLEEQRLEQQFQGLTRDLLFAMQDFDYLSEALLDSVEVNVKDKCLQVGEMVYDVVIVPELITIRSSTLNCLRQFRACGGMVIFAGKAPRCVDAQLSEAPKQFAASCSVQEEADGILKLLEPYRQIRVLDDKRQMTKDLIYQLRDDGRNRWLFICHGKADVSTAGSLELQITGRYQVCQYDPEDGSKREISYRTEAVYTSVFAELHEQDSLLLCLLPADSSKMQEIRRPKRKCIQEIVVPDQMRYRLEEPNMLLLDQMEYSLDGESWQPSMEILRIDEEIRRKLGMIRRTDSFPQPWLREPLPKTHLVGLRCHIDSEIDLPRADFVWEGEDDVSVLWNGNFVDLTDRDFYLDSCMHRIPLDRIRKGENILELQIPFGESTNLEWAYLQGDFGVQVSGGTARICSFPSQISFGDYTTMGFAFYGGNLIYETEIELEEGMAEIEVSQFQAPLLGVSIDASPFQSIFKTPYRAKLGHIERGIHRLRLICYGSRINQYGQIHNCGPATQYFGPSSFRTSGEMWSDDYCLKPCGVITPPVLRIYEETDSDSCCI